MGREQITCSRRIRRSQEPLPRQPGCRDRPRSRAHDGLRSALAAPAGQIASQVEPAIADQVSIQPGPLDLLAAMIGGLGTTLCRPAVIMPVQWPEVMRVERGAGHANRRTHDPPHGRRHKTQLPGEVAALIVSVDGAIQPPQSVPKVSVLGLAGSWPINCDGSTLQIRALMALIVSCRTDFFGHQCIGSLAKLRNDAEAVR